jgi:hypothetical protein
MKKQVFMLSSLLIAVAVLIGSVGCKKKSSTPDFGLTGLHSGNIDMNGGTPASNVPSLPTITASFSNDVNGATATSNNITLVRAYDTVSVDITISVSAGIVTIVPKSDLGNGTLYLLTFLPGLMSVDDQSIGTVTRSFSTIGTFVPTGAVAYWNFENNTNDQLGTYNSDFTANIGFVNSHSTAAGQAASFDGTTSIIEIPNADPLVTTTSFSLTFWVKAISGLVDTSGGSKGQFVLGLGASYGFEFEIDGAYKTCKMAASYNVNDTASRQDLWFPADGNVTYPGWTFCRDLTNLGGLAAIVKDSWANVACVYNGATKIGTMYINGQVEKQQDFNLYPADNPARRAIGMKWFPSAEVTNALAFGFIKSRASTLFNDTPWGNYDHPYANHFHGYLDEVRIFHRALTPYEVSLMYTSSK